MLSPTLSHKSHKPPSYEEAYADQLVETTWRMIKTMLFSVGLFQVYLLVEGEAFNFWTLSVFISAFVGAWILYRKQWFVFARYFVFFGALLGCLMVLANFGTTSFSYFLFGPVILAAMTVFRTAFERYSISLLSLLLASLVVAFEVEVELFPNMGPGDDFQSIFVFLTFILERTNKRLEEEISNKVKVERELSSSNEQLSQFAYAASHDLKEPLRSITSFIQLIRRKVRDIDDDALDVHASAVHDSTTKMATLLDDLLAFSRAGGVSQTSSLVDLTDVVEGVILIRIKAFQLFEKENANPELGGSGVGLAIAQKIVQASGGDISFVSSKTGVGVTCRILLPSAGT